MKPIRKTLLILILASSVTGWASPAEAGEPAWEKIQSYPVTLFYPGVASWEFLLSEDHRLGARNIEKGRRSCRDCHVDKKSGSLDVQANEIASGQLKMKQSQKLFEPDPIPGKKGFLEVQVQAAFDDEYFYIRLEWPSIGGSWEDPTLEKKGIVDGVAIQVNAAQGPFKQYGCFINCHSDVDSMPQTPLKTEVRKHPYYAGLQREDVKLYAYYTRKKGWAEMKNGDELNHLLKEHGVVDLWAVEFIGNRVVSEDGSIFEDRKKDPRVDVEASGGWEKGRYTAVLKRKLRTGDPQDAQLREGTEITIGIAVHDDKVRQRKHYVSFPIILGLGVQGYITAFKIH
jgi:cytochrome c-type protein NapC